MGSVGFIGIGLMGQPMALNLLHGGVALTVWNRTIEKCHPLKESGALIAPTARDVFRSCATIILMLIDDKSIDTVLERGTDVFIKNVSGRTIINMSTTSPDYSRYLSAEIRAAGGLYVEAPVSGSRRPAEEGQLVAMTAGDTEAKADLAPLLSLMCKTVFDCGQVPNALLMKLSVNLFMISMVTGLVEAFNFADRQGVDTVLLEQILNDSPMSNNVVRVKVDKLVRADFTPQASIDDVYKNNRLIRDAAHRACIPTPLLEVCYSLYQRTQALGFGGSDMVSVLRAIERGNF